MENKKLVCIGCPLGCLLSVECEGGQIKSVTGNTCPKGEQYARAELIHPTRTLTTTVRVKDGAAPVVSVKTKNEIPKEMIGKCMEELARITVAAPVYMNDTIVDNIAGTKVAVIATKQVEKLK